VANPLWKGKVTMNKKIGVVIVSIGLAISMVVPFSASGAKDVSLLVWTDTVRNPGHKAYAKLNPQYKINIQDQGANLLSKVQLFNRVKKGWPDMYFEAGPNRVAIMQSIQFGYAAPLDKLFPASYWKSFGAANDWCKIDGKMYCVKNDLAHTVLYYDQKLMDQFGYKVPTTMAEFETIALDLAKDHPGYNVGSMGEGEIYQGWLWPSGCPMATAKGSKVVSNVKDPKCTRVATMVQKLLDAKVLLKSSSFSADTQKDNQAGKMLMNIGPSWWGDYVVSPAGSFGVPAGRINIAPTPKWPGETKNWSGAWGGGVFMISSHSSPQNQKIAAEMIQFSTSDKKFVVSDAMVTYPAYPPAAKLWLKNLEAKGYYVDSKNTSKVFSDSSLLIRPTVTPVRFDIDAFIGAMGADITQGKTVQAAMESFFGKIASAATLSGYEVSTK
jgi:multiple sugar transport system substrate-binding protein